eukprot:GHVL01043567.1.p1 GENE.GHVL01043567.1~~GHVL01043567.1.p1  ORF type:complete len:1484 (+),score=353.60 GHVL01043567.1:54-4505(+)
MSIVDEYFFQQSELTISHNYDQIRSHQKPKDQINNTNEVKTELTSEPQNGIVQSSPKRVSVNSKVMRSLGDGSCCNNLRSLRESNAIRAWAHRWWINQPIYASIQESSINRSFFAKINIKNMKIPASLIDFSHQINSRTPLNFNFRLNASFYNSNLRQFYGRTAVTDVIRVSARELSKTAEGNYILHNVHDREPTFVWTTSVTDERSFLVVEVVLISVDYQVSDKSIKNYEVNTGLIWGFYPLSSIPKTKSAIDITACKGTPRCLSFYNSINQLFAELGTSSKISVIASNIEDKNINKLINKNLPENYIHCANLHLCGLDYQSNASFSLNNIKASSSLNFIIKDAVVLLPSQAWVSGFIQSIKEVSHRITTGDFYPNKDDITCPEPRIVGYRLDIGVHNGIKMIDTSQEKKINLSRNSENPLALHLLANGTSDEFIEDEECAIIMELVVLIEISFLREDSRECQIFEIIVGWLPFLPYWLSPQFCEKLEPSNHSDGNHNLICRKLLTGPGSSVTGSRVWTPPTELMNESPRVAFHLGGNILNSLKKYAANRTLIKLEKKIIIEKTNEEKILNKKVEVPVKKEFKSYEPPPVCHRPPPPEESISPRRRPSPPPPVMKPLPPPIDMSPTVPPIEILNTTILSSVMIQTDELLVTSPKPREVKVEKENVLRPRLVSEIECHRLAQCYSDETFISFMNYSINSTSVASNFLPVDYDIGLELSDVLLGHEITFQYLGYSSFVESSTDQIFLVSRFFTFPTVSTTSVGVTDRGRQESAINGTSVYNTKDISSIATLRDSISSPPTIKYIIDGSQPIESQLCGLKCNGLTNDKNPAITAETAKILHDQFCLYLMTQTIEIEVWDSKSSMQIGLVTIRLSDFRRKGSNQVSYALEYPVVDVFTGCICGVISILITHRGFHVSNIISSKKKNSKKNLQITPLRIRQENNKNINFLSNQTSDNCSTCYQSTNDWTVLLNDSNFTGSNFNGSNFTGSNFNGSNFNGSNFTGSNFNGSNFNGSNFTGSNFNGSNFTKTSDVSFIPLMNETSDKMREMSRIREEHRIEILNKRLDEKLRDTAQLYPTFGCMEIFSVTFNNPYKEETYFQVVVDDDEYSKVYPPLGGSDADLRVVNSLYELNMLSDGFSSPFTPIFPDNRGIFFLKGYETVVIPFKFFSIRGGNGDLTIDVSYPTKIISKSIIYLSISKIDGPKLHQLDIEVKIQPSLRSRTFRFWENKNETVSKILPISSEFYNDEILCTDPNTSVHWLNDTNRTSDKIVSNVDSYPISNKKLINVSMVNSNLNGKCFHIIFYKNKKEIDQIYLICLYTTIREIIDTKVGLTIKRSIQVPPGLYLDYPTPGGDQTRTVEIFTDNYGLVQPKPEKLTIGQDSDFFINVSPYMEGNQECRLQMIDYLSRRVIGSWIISVTATPPHVNSSHEIISLKDIVSDHFYLFYNPLKINKNFRFRSSNSFLMKVYKKIYIFYLYIYIYIYIYLL